ncbi:MAG: DUF4352 domain-containing protein [Acidobacteriota bacterium]|nr:DUF4352 domain-containing protein [Acidobacteriota bacterium]
MLLLTIGGLGLATILFIFAIWKKQVWLRNFVPGAVAVWLAIYAVTLLGFSLASEEKNLGFNEPKAFCGFYLDCHLHASVSGVRKTKTIGDKTAGGEFYIVKVRVFSNARRAALGLRAPEIYVIDDGGKRYERVEAVENPAPPFERKIPAGAGFEREVVFDLPADVKNPRLDVAEGIGVNRVIEAVLIGDEDSLLHKRARFNLEQNTVTANF